jgi:hypothetical protein
MGSRVVIFDLLYIIIFEKKNRENSKENKGRKVALFITERRNYRKDRKISTSYDSKTRITSCKGF